MFSYFPPESRVPATHPLRAIKAHADVVLKSMSNDFDALYASDGRPSIAPEWLLKGSILIAHAAKGCSLMSTSRSMAVNVG
jgi:transposase